MDEKKYAVPAGMLDAFRKAETHHGRVWDAEVLEAMLTAALRWLAENPIVPTPEQMNKLRFDTCDNDMTTTFNQRSINLATAWQRRMFLAPEPEIPEAVKDLLWKSEDDGKNYDPAPGHNRDVIEAYRRGTLSHDEK